MLVYISVFQFASADPSGTAALSPRQFGEIQVERIWKSEGLEQFSERFSGAGISEAEIAQKAYVSGILGKKGFAGIKGAVVGKGGQDMFEIDGPLSAVLFRDGWLDAKETPEVPIREGASPGIETELGIVFGERVDSPIPDVETLKKKVRAIVPVIELPAGKHNWSAKPMATDLVASNVDSDKYIVGEACVDLAVDLDSVPVKLYSGGRILNDTTGGDARNGQWWNFLRQVNWAVENGYSLSPGDLVITGALGKIVREGAGKYRAEYGQLGEIEFSLTGP